MALKSINTVRRRLADEVYDQLVEAIMNQDIGPDDRLIQEKLAAELEISRTPIREALLRLEKEGVLQVANSGGFRLVSFNQDDILQLYQARAAIEVQAARILTARADGETLDRLRTLIQREENLTNPKVRDYFRANRNIHRAFVEEANNKFLLEMFDMIWGKARAFHLFATIEAAGLENSLGQHLELVDVMATGDLTKAHDAFTKHIQEGYELQLSGVLGTQG